MHHVSDIPGISSAHSAEERPDCGTAGAAAETQGGEGENVENFISSLTGNTRDGDKNFYWEFSPGTVFHLNPFRLSR